MSDGGGGGGAAAAKHLSAVAIAFTCFSLVSGGPVGIEDAVGSAGALAAMGFLAAVAVLWALPQSLITAELSTAVPSNGGTIDWVWLALGPVGGMCNAVSLVFNQLFDLPLYPSLLLACLQQVVTVPTAWGVVAQVAVVAVVVVLNVLGMDAVASSASALTVFIVVPFLALPVVAVARGATFTWSALAPAATPPGWQASLPVFVSGILWNMQGWTGVGNLAAEIKDPQRSYPLGVTAAVVMVTASYAYSILFGTVLHPALADWQDGYFVNVAQQVANWLGVWSAVAAAVANLSTCLSSMAAYSRSLQAAAAAGFVPLPLLARNYTRWQTPVPAILLLGATTMGLMFIDLSSLVLLDTTFSNVSIVLTTVSFLVLRRTAPTLPRPFKLGGGWRGAWAAAAPVLLLAAFAFYAVGSTAYALAVPLGVNAAVAVASAAARAWCPRRFRCLTVAPHHYLGLPAAAAAAAAAAATVAADTDAAGALARALDDGDDDGARVALLPPRGGSAFPVTLHTAPARMGSLELDDPAVGRQYAPRV